MFLDRDKPKEHKQKQNIFISLSIFFFKRKVNHRTNVKHHYSSHINISLRNFTSCTAHLVSKNKRIKESEMAINAIRNPVWFVWQNNNKKKKQESSSMNDQKPLLTYISRRKEKRKVIQGNKCSCIEIYRKYLKVR